MTEVLIGTTKGAWTLKGRASQKKWTLSKPHFFGHEVNHFLQDPRNPKLYVLAAKTGHLGPTVFVSTDRGDGWKEASAPPAFPKGDSSGRAVERVFWLSPGHADDLGEWYAGTCPVGLFHSVDHGRTWTSVKGFNDNAYYKLWTQQGGTPGGPMLHSIIVDPRDAKHLYLGVSVGGVFESRDRGVTWNPLNAGVDADFMPTKGKSDYGHDPHCVVIHPRKPDRLYQQNHCGIYRIDRPSDTWERIGKKMPKAIGDIGFPIVVHPENPDQVWVFPMDGTSVWPRTSPQGKPAVYRTDDAGRSWRRLDRGFPKEQGWFTVYRQSMALAAGKKTSLFIGTTSGEVWGSFNDGETWHQLAQHLPKILSVTVAAE